MMLLPMLRPSLSVCKLHDTIIDKPLLCFSVCVHGVVCCVGSCGECETVVATPPFFFYCAKSQKSLNHSITVFATTPNGAAVQLSAVISELKISFQCEFE